MTRIVTTDEGEIRCTEFTSFSKLDIDSLEPRYRAWPDCVMLNAAVSAKYSRNSRKGSGEFFYRVESGPRNFPKPQANDRVGGHLGTLWRWTSRPISDKEESLT